MVLNKPYTSQEYKNFAKQANENNQRIEIDENAVYALYPYEILENGQVVDISQTPEYIAEQEQKEAERKAQRKITKRQLLIYLFTQHQKTEDDILTAIESIQDEAQKYLAKVNYQGTNDFYFGNEFVPVIGTALGLTEAEIDAMFDNAGGL